MYWIIWETTDKSQILRPFFYNDFSLASHILQNHSFFVFVCFFVASAEMRYNSTVQSSIKVLVTKKIPNMTFMFKCELTCKSLLAAWIWATWTQPHLPCLHNTNIILLPLLCCQESAAQLMFNTKGVCLISPAQEVFLIRMMYRTVPPHTHTQKLNLGIFQLSPS